MLPATRCVQSNARWLNQEGNMNQVRIGIVGLGANTRLRHVPGLLRCEGVSIHAVCNRRPDSTAAVAAEFGIPKTYGDWRHLVDDPTIDAVVIGTWPYLHCEITLAALEAGKHVLTEARMAMNASEAHAMLDASQRHPHLVTQIVPSPLGLKAHRTVKGMISSGFLGELREVIVLGTDSGLANASTQLHWRQIAEYSGVNMLALIGGRPEMLRHPGAPQWLIAARDLRRSST